MRVPQCGVPVRGADSKLLTAANGGRRRSNLEPPLLFRYPRSRSSLVLRLVSFLRRIPFLSLTILWLLYGVLGWLLAAATTQWQIWALSACGIVLLALAFTAPSSLVRTAFASMLQSDARAFLTVVILAFAAVIALTWLRHFARLVVLIAAGSLARLELQAAEYGEWQAFSLLSVASLGGFGLGLWLHRYLYPLLMAG